MGKSVFVNGGAPERAGFPALFIWYLFLAARAALPFVSAGLFLYVRRYANEVQRLF